MFNGTAFKYDFFEEAIIMKFKFTKETLKRMIKTFVQTAAGYVIVNVAGVDFTGDKDILKSTLIGLAISASSAGLAALMNLQSPATAEEE